jgi:hypothetical protein
MHRKIDLPASFLYIVHQIAIIIIFGRLLTEVFMDRDKHIFSRKGGIGT